MSYVLAIALGLLPALLLFALLMFGRYPGERAIHVAREILSGRSRRRFTSDSAQDWRLSPFSNPFISGGLLIAESLAGRAPPAHATH